MDSSKKKYNGIAVALAWPETYCKQANAWYDKLMRLLGFNNDYFYQAGHAAVLLVEKNGEKCHYFDFGRYHSPFGTGRVRSDQTDPELEVKTKPHFSVNGKEIINIREILSELQSKYSYHGDGRLYSSQYEINFDKAYQKAIDMQSREFMSYGPFVINGTNCSRFVSTVIAAGSPPIINLLMLKLLVPTTPTTLTNVRAGRKGISIPKLCDNGDEIVVIQPNYRNWAKDLSWLSKTFPQPEKHSDIPGNAQWISGEGYGSWYHLENVNESLILTKYSPKGEFEHRTIFTDDYNLFDPGKPFLITYPTNNQKLTLVQGEKKFSIEKKH